MKRKLMRLLLIILLVFIILILRFGKYYSESCDIYAKTAVKGDITRNVNTSIYETLNQHNIDYSEIAKIDRNTDNSISSITIDSIKINKIANELSSKIYDCIISKSHTYGIPLGNVLGYKYISGMGPKIPITIIPIGAANYKINSDFFGEGINQTVHRISIVFTTEIVCTVPFHKCNNLLEYEIILSETLIVGKIPQVFLSS